VLVTQCHEPFDLDPIALTSGRALHSDQVIERGDGNGEIVRDHESNGVDDELLVRVALSRRLAKTVEWSELRAEEEVLAVQDRTLVDGCGNSSRQVAPLRVDLAEGGR
jgi:hypothetical protein